MRIAQLAVLLAFTITTPASAAPTPGEPWGPCIDGACGPDTLCLWLADGSYCAPGCSSPVCSAPVESCDAVLTPSCTPTGACALECVDAGDCLMGQVCTWGLCAWPPLAPGGAWTPCDGGCDGGFCIQSSAGSVCLPACDDGACKSPADACGDELPAECAPTGACILPCDPEGECWGSPGMVCDHDADMCMFA